MPSTCLWTKVLVSGLPVSLPDSLVFQVIIFIFLLTGHCNTLYYVAVQFVWRLWAREGGKCPLVVSKVLKSAWLKGRLYKRIV